MGKSRIIGGIIVENWCLGRRRALWISVNENLIADAERELRLLRYRGKIYKNFADAEDNGVIIVTYKYISTRLADWKPVLSNWLQSGQEDFGGPVRDYWKEFFLSCTDGPSIFVCTLQIIFDECHKAKGEKTGIGKTVVNIQEDYPRARVVYVSATATTDLESMHYMSRLGLWGPEFSIKSAKDFRNYIGNK